MCTYTVHMMQLAKLTECKNNLILWMISIAIIFWDIWGSGGEGGGGGGKAGKR